MRYALALFPGAATVAMANLNDFKAFIGIRATNTSQDLALQLYLDGADAAIKSELGRDLESTTYPGAAEGGSGDAGFYSGAGSRYLRLKQYPVWGTPEVWLDSAGRFGLNPDGAFATATKLVYGTDFVLVLDGCLPGTTTKCSNRGMLERIAAPWPERYATAIGRLSAQPIGGGGNIKVAYSAGYPTIPADLQAACMQLAAYIRRGAEHGGTLTSESLGGYSYSVAAQASAGALPELGSLRALARKYKELAI